MCGAIKLTLFLFLDRISLDLSSRSSIFRSQSLSDLDFLQSQFDKIDDVPTMLPEIFLVEDDAILGKTIKTYLEKKLGVTVHYFVCPEKLLSFVEDIGPSNLRPFCLISDISFEQDGTDGLLLLDILRDKKIELVSILMTGFASIETAISATKKGVFHYLTKPFDLEALLDLVKKAFTQKLGISEECLLSFTNQVTLGNNSKVIERKFKLESPKSEDIFCGMIGRSKLMKSVFERIEKVAASGSTVLIHGPSGTGKELVARAIHSLSTRQDNSMVTVNCGAIPGELLESELFGHVKGAFTGAISDRKGRFEVADNGTIFLDEIGDMPLLLQVKLLRVLQSREIEKVGGTSTTPIDVRIITATHRNLEDQVRNGDFREDLYYRLNVIPIVIPSLSQRREDIPLLISYFLSRFTSADGRNEIEFDDDALEVLMTYDWPGNVRELENLIERLVILKGGGIVKVKDLPSKLLHHMPSKSSQYDGLISLTQDGIDLKQTLSDIEDSLIVQALDMTSGNKNKASKLLNINRTTLIEKLKKKGMLQLN